MEFIKYILDRLRIVVWNWIVATWFVIHPFRAFRMLILHGYAMLYTKSAYSLHKTAIQIRLFVIWLDVSFSKHHGEASGMKYAINKWVSEQVTVNRIKLNQVCASGIVFYVETYVNHKPVPTPNRALAGSYAYVLYKHIHTATAHVSFWKWFLNNVFA